MSWTRGGSQGVETAGLSSLDIRLARGSAVGLSLVYLIALVAVILSYRHPRTLRSAFLTGVTSMLIFMGGSLLAGDGRGLLAANAPAAFLLLSAAILAARQDWRERQPHVDWVHVPRSDDGGPPEGNG